ncbi:replication protein A [Ancylostoma caninum]|uniref:Replication protein A n=1 Tax=Ancylostoma caninum TaxID=29170 RepID=A0A368FFQ3_ANCCA|nr:replication protein A [Ancylostoma caninum]
MAWNESFSAADAGGWAGDTSFATAPPKEAQSAKVAERLPVPVTIADLHDSANADEKYELGDYPFSTVLTMGIVKSVSEQENTTNHVLGDPEDMNKDFEVLTYNGVSEAELGTSTFVEGTRVIVVGKLRSLSDRHGMFLYTSTLHMCFFLCNSLKKLVTFCGIDNEAIFLKNVPSILRSGMGEGLSGCAAGPPADAGVPSGPKENLSVFGSQTTRLYGTPGATSSVARGHNLDGQRGKIMDLLQREKDNYDSIGMSEGDIKKAIGAMNMDSLRKDLQFLVNEGHIYNTTDDEHYALID